MSGKNRTLDTPPYTRLRASQVVRSYALEVARITKYQDDIIQYGEANLVVGILWLCHSVHGD